MYEERIEDEHRGYFFSNFIIKLNYTEDVYLALRQQFSQLKNGKSDITWPEMWDFYNKLDNPDLLEYNKKNDKLLYYHLLYGLQKNEFFMLPKDYYIKWMRIKN